MADSKAEAIFKGFDQAVSLRSTWQSHWDEIARLVSPKDNEFFTKRTPGAKRTKEIFDTTAPIMSRRFASVMSSIFTPRDQEYQRIQANIPELNKIDSVRIFFDELTSLIFRRRYNARGGFAHQINEIWNGVGLWGTAGLMVTDRPGKQPGYKSMHLSRLYIIENSQGLIDSTYIKYEFTADQAAEEYGIENLPESIAKKVGKVNTDEKHCFVQYIRPNKEEDPNSMNPEKMPFSSTHISIEDKHVVREGGFRIFPLAIARAETSPMEVYGRSPSMMLLPTIKVLNEMKRTQIRMGHRVVDPIVLLRDDSAVNRRDMRPGNLIVGGLDQNGNDMMKPFNSGAQVDTNEFMMDKERETIEKGYLNDIFLLQQEREMTATEVLHRAKEQSMLMSAFSGNQEAEFLGHLIEIEMDILELSGQMPQLPPELLEADAGWEPVYTGPTARSRKAEAAIGSQQVVQEALNISNFAPEVLDTVNFDIHIETMREAGGAPNALTRSEEEVADIRQARAQAQSDQQGVENLNSVSQSGLNAAKTEEVMAGMET